mmetsp:Transcript_59895/g.160345  ORF Transcript_59895/g.160345 Transcript_59895/m.160345 type:complete len:180 (-) Transcript_59895:497-1036(-)
MISPPTMPAPAWAAGVGAVARQEAMAGALGGVSATGVAMFVSHPLDTLKTRVQAKGWGASAKELARQPFYGIGPHVAWYSLFNMVRFSCFCSLRGCAERSTGLTGWHSAAVAGAGAGLVTGVTLHPFFCDQGVSTSDADQHKCGLFHLGQCRVFVHSCSRISVGLCKISYWGGRPVFGE